MAFLGSTAKPIICRVQTEDRAIEVNVICDANGWKCIVGIEPNKPEDLAHLKRALKSLPPQLPDDLKRVSPNDYCPCGSNKKFKKCCALTSIPA